MNESRSANVAIEYDWLVATQLKEDLEGKGAMSKGMQ